MEDKKSIWNEAASAGLILGGVSVAYLLISWLLSKIQPDGIMSNLVMTISSAILWAAKFYCCLKVLIIFMKRFSESEPEAGSTQIFRFGSIVSMLSALVYAAAYLAYVKYLVPDIFNQTIDMMRQNPMMDSNALEALDSMMPKLPMISFTVNLIYCSIFGIIASAIIARNIHSDNPFDGEETDNQ